MFEDPLTSSEALKQAQLYLSEGMTEFPVVLSGNILVNYLHDMCQRRGITMERRTTPEETLNDLLLGLHAYDANMHATIAQWLEMRRMTVGNQSNYSYKEVKSMLDGILEFIGSDK